MYLEKNTPCQPKPLYSVIVEAARCPHDVGKHTYVAQALK